jgi:hypothetical protein
MQASWHKRGFLAALLSWQGQPLCDTEFLCNDMICHRLFLLVNPEYVCEPTLQEHNQSFPNVLAYFHF